MHPFQRKALERFCREHALDTQLIDDSLTYAENKKILESLAIKIVDELLIWTKTFEDMEHFSSLGDLYGVPYNMQDVDKALILLKAYVKLSRRVFKIALNRLKSFNERVRAAAFGYLEIQGQPSEISKMLEKIEDLKPRVLRISKRFDKGFQYLAGYGWVRKET